MKKEKIAMQQLTRLIIVLLASGLFACSLNSRPVKKEKEETISCHRIPSRFAAMNTEAMNQGKTMDDKEKAKKKAKEKAKEKD